MRYELQPRMRCKSVPVLEIMLRNAIFLPLLGSVTAFAFSDGCAADLMVEISDARGRSVPDAVVVATAIGVATPSASPAKAAVMDQVGKAFVPNVLVVRTGTAVVFPNSDTVAHQVYSFSQPKRFELPLYRGQAHPPVTFDQPGLIVLGCNIHDSMVGYIYVTDSPYFGTTDERGLWTMNGLPPGEYELTIWSPRLPRDTALAKQRVTVGDHARAVAELRLKETLRPAAGTSQDARIREY